MTFSSSLLVVFALLYQTPAFAQRKSTDAHAKQIESVLDRLEKKLIDKESSPLTQEENERAVAAERNSGKTPQQQRYIPKSPANVRGETQSGRNIQEVQKKLNEYDNRIEILESEMRRLRSGISESAATDNVVSVQLKTDNNRPVILKTLAASLDGNTLYSQIDPAGLWIPSKIIPLFYGPLKPGTHRLDITSTVASIKDNEAGSGAWRQKTLSQSFQFSVPEGKQRKSITVEVGQSTGSEGTPVAVLYESEVK